MKDAPAHDAERPVKDTPDGDAARPVKDAPAHDAARPEQDAPDATPRGVGAGDASGARVTDLTDPRYRPPTLASAAYRPSPALIAAIMGRDRTCTFPGCLQPATRCDIDHIEPFDHNRPAPEQTHYNNLHLLCRRHHNLKTHGGWHLTRDPATGITTWTSPTGRTHIRLPHTATTHTGHPPGTQAPPRHDGRDDGDSHDGRDGRGGRGDSDDGATRNDPDGRDG